jgi:hypothetical protein
MASKASYRKRSRGPGRGATQLAARGTRAGPGGQSGRPIYGEFAGCTVAGVRGSGIRSDEAAIQEILERSPVSV